MINQMPIYLFPFKKEELNVSIQFEGDESLEIEYQLKHKNDIGGDFKEFFFNSAFLIIEDNLQSSNLKENDFKYEKQSLNENLWDITSNDILKCKIDEKNEMNVIIDWIFSNRY